MVGTLHWVCCLLVLLPVQGGFCPLASGNWEQSCPGPTSYQGPCQVSGSMECAVNTECKKVSGNVVATSFVYKASAAPVLQNIDGLLTASDGTKGKSTHTQLPCHNTTRLQAHVVAHSHDDVGWLLTPDEYYDGCKQGDPSRGVRGIIGSVVQALQANPQRRFIEVEQYFFQRWWNDQTDEVKNITKGLVREGRLEFINGGWSMHDEACVHHRSAVENMALGAQWIKREFNATVRIGWHIDPFGHASATPRLMAQMGFDAFFFCGTRIDRQQKQHLMDTKTLEQVWDSSPSLGSKVSMFMSVLYDHYDAGCFDACKSGFCCFDGCSHQNYDFGPEEWVTPNRGKSPSLRQLADQYAAKIQERAAYFRTPLQLLAFGDDFQFQTAEDNFRMMDQVMATVNADTSYGIDMFYSTPSRYVDALNKLQAEWPVNRDDFYPMSDGDHAYWTGYFTSRAAFKGYERTLMAELLASDILHALSSTPTPKELEPLRGALGVSQHHDSITGTEKQFVRNDYQKMLYTGAKTARESVGSRVAKMGGLPSTASALSCPLANISICPATLPLARGHSVTLVLFNPLGWARSELFEIPVPTSNLTITTASGTHIPHDVIPATFRLVPDPTSPTTGQTRQPHTALFRADIPAFGTTTYRLSPVSTPTTPPPSSHTSTSTTIENEAYSVTITNGVWESVTNKKTKITIPVSQKVGWYCPAASGQASGAYIFRPCPTRPGYNVWTPNPTVTVTKGSLMEQVEITINDASHVSQVIRLVKGVDHITVIAGVGEIQLTAEGHEIVMEFRTNLTTEETWYTDSEGLEDQKRVLNRRPNYNITITEPIASNFYPSNTWAYLLDHTADSSFLWVSDRSRAVSGLKDGGLDIFLHRRCVRDDGRGVGEVLSEKTRIITTNYLTAGTPISHLAEERRRLSTHLTYPPQAFYFTDAPSGNPPAPLAQPLPPNVNLLGLQTTLDGPTLLRLHHMYAVGEDTSLSKPVTIDVAKLFPSLGVKGLVEMGLNGQTPLSEIHRLQWKTTAVVGAGSRKVGGGVQGTSVTLEPMDIRTFSLDR